MGSPSGVCICSLALWLALAIDWLLGEPPARWHPVVWMGSYLGWAGRRIAPPWPAPDGEGRDLGAFGLGAAAWCAGAALVLAAACAVDIAAHRLPWWAAALLWGAALKPLLAWRMLHDEVLAVEAALAVSLDAGRARLARLVSRDVSALSEVEVRESAIESLAENLNDSLVAPLFWFALGGLPVAAIYRFANTADAMWGYRGERDGRDWTWAGKWAARADDLLSWLPARLAALLLWLCSWVFRGHFPAKTGRAGTSAFSLRSLRAEAARTPSPNSGWPMAAMALLLGVRLGKPGVYTLNGPGRRAVAADTARAAALGSRVVMMLGGCASVLILLGAKVAWP